jgi:hypothetical protein
VTHRRHNTPDPWAPPRAIRREPGDAPWVLVVVIGQLILVLDDTGITVTTAWGMGYARPVTRGA